MLDDADFSDLCTYSERIEHEYRIYGIYYSGAYDLWTECGDTETMVISLAGSVTSHWYGRASSE